jgi:GAF domain-containing protein
MGRASAKAKVAGKRPAAAKSAKNKKVSVARDVEKRLAAALAQQKATNEILRVMSASPSDVQPVLDAVAQRAARLCDAPYARVLLTDGDVVRQAADYSTRGRRVADPARPVPLLRSSITGRAILDRKTVHITDLVPLLDCEYPDARANAHTAGFRTILAVPLMSEGRAYGGVMVYRRVVRRFTRDQVALVETFARQAAIAIDSVRLFRETSEALEQQTATSQILRVISQSQTDAQPVFDTIARAALELCGTSSAVVTRFDGELIRLAALANVRSEAADALRRRYPRPPSRDTGNARAILTGKVVVIPDAFEDPEYAIGSGATAMPFRSILAVPLLRDGSPIGSIGVTRDEPGTFSEKQVALLQTFADQAVIAIENVRLFNETRDALEQQTATAQILQAISSSPGDLQPVLDTVVRAAAQFCGAPDVVIMRLDNEVLRGAAAVGAFGDVLTQRLGSVSALELPVSKASVTGRSVVERRSIHIQDLAAEREDEFPLGRELQRQLGHRCVVSTPLLREGVPIGAILLFRSEPKPFSDKQLKLLQLFADQAVIAIENVRLFTELGARNRELTEALEQQTATSEILRVISQSQTNVRPVFETIVRSVLALCDATFSGVYLLDGEIYSLAATAGLTSEERAAFASGYPRKIGPDTVAGRAALERRVVQTPDLLSDPNYWSSPGSRVGARTVLGVPMLRDGKAIGSIGVWRSEVKPFSDTQIALLQTFADQAVIAIENVRLFTQLEQRNSALADSLERQTATSEILRVISRSQTDVQPVFDTIAAAVLRLCQASSANVLTFDGTLLHIAALANVNPESENAIRQVYPIRPSRDTAVARAVLTRSVVEIPDILEDADYVMRDASLAAGFRSVLGIPLMRDGNPIGAMAIGRPQPGPYDKAHVELVKTFADQAVIAIENVRLFTELQRRNHEITEALERQTATSEILRVISASPRDVQPVFDAIAGAALRLCAATTAMVARYDGTLIHLVAIANLDPGGLAALREVFPRPPSRDTTSTRAILTGEVVVIPDVLSDADYTVGNPALRAGYRSTLAVPLLQAGHPIGCITVGRSEPGTFSDSQIALLQTFADQAVIAIENVRLFTELESRTAELSRSVSELRALGDVGQAVSSTLDLETVLSTIVTRATQLAGMDAGAIYEYDEEREEFFLHTADRFSDELIEALRAAPIRKGEGALGRLAVTSEPVQVHDITDPGVYQSRVRKILLGLGLRSVLAVPLLREDRLLGGLTMNRKTPGAFAPEVVALLQTFATQSALAIQNARLFREIEEKSRELETASRHKSEFLANMSHELRTPLNAIIGFSEVLSEKLFGDLNAKQEEYLTDILESGRHLLSLINDILDLSKVEAGRMELEAADFQLPSAIDNALTLVRERAGRHGVRLERAVDPRLGTICADERKVKQVLLNLLSNALKFTPEGGRVDVNAHARDGMAEISVTDTGVGIAPEDQDAVFEEFKQVGSSAKKREGTGLGLAISRKFIELHGGKIWLKSEVGAGSTFTFTLPLPGKQHHSLH